MRKLPFLTSALLGFLAIGLQAEESYTPGEPVVASFDDFAFDFLDFHCLGCHDEASRKGDLSLENLGPVDAGNADVWKAIWAQVSLREMPPKKKDQPEVVERLKFSEWIVSELEKAMKDKGGFQAHLDPKKANFLDHDLLFGKLPKGLRLVPASSPARLWRITPEEHITRLNGLINTEPAFQAAKPGLRTHGDAVPTNHGGELKLYFGADRIIKWQGGTVAYATAVKSVPAVLSSSRKQGFENYAHFQTVNSAEATRILAKAEDILRYMAYGPLSIAKPEQITDNPATYKMKGDIRGLPSAIVYNTKVVRPLTPVCDLMKDPKAGDDKILAAIDDLFEALTFRPPAPAESQKYLQIVKDTVSRVGREDGIFMGLSAIFLHQDALFRPELARQGSPDSHGRVMLQDWELGLALNHALRYLKPDEQLRNAITAGRMRTRKDVEREVTRLLDDPAVRKPRVLRFFREFFDHDLGGYICKDAKALGQTGAPGGNSHYRAMFDATASTDRLIELILAEDKEVLKQLLTTQKVVAEKKRDSTYFGRLQTKDEIATARIAQKKSTTMASIEAAENVKILQVKLAALQQDSYETPNDPRNARELKRARKALSSAQGRLKALNKGKRGGNLLVAPAKLTGPPIFARVGPRSFGNGSLRPERILATAPENERLGILTHPSWLVSHSDAMDNHAIHRGIWIRERLLGGGIPDVPITVDAMLPEEPKHTLRERMRVTREK